MTACTEDYKDWASPMSSQTPDATTTLTMSEGGTVTPESATIDFANFTEGQTSVKVCTVEAAQPVEGVTKGGDYIKLDEKETFLLNNGEMMIQDLKNYLEKTYGKAPTERTINASVYTTYSNGKVTIRSISPTFQLKAKLVAPFIDEAYYLVGDFAAWAKEGALSFTHIGDGNVYDNPKFQILFRTNADNQYWKIIPKTNYDGDFWASGTTGVVGTAVDGDVSKEGLLTTNNPQAGKIEKAGLYRMTIDMMEYTYKIEELNFTDFIYTVGNVNGTSWDKSFPLYGPDFDGKYQGSYYLGNEFKFKPYADVWDGDWGQDPDGAIGKLVQEGENNCMTTAEGFYMIDVNLATMEYTLTPITKVCMVGGAVGDDWDNGVEMTYNKTKNCWECDATFTKADVIKFKGNGTWDTFDGNWGGTMDNIVNGSNDNIPVTLTGNVHVEFYPSCNTKSYCTITPAN